MKFARVVQILLLAMFALASGASLHAASKASTSDTVSKVVKMLQEMLDRSMHDQEGTRVLYAKQKCFCDQNSDSTKASISEVSKDISLLEAEIQELLGSNAVLSTEVAQLTQSIKDNEESRAASQQLRSEQHTDYEKAKQETTAAISQIDGALQTLEEAREEASMEHRKFMAGSSLMNLDSRVRQVLISASAMLTQDQKAPVAELLQAPFQGDYRSQSGQVVGILSNMKKTFLSNLEAAKSSERAAQETFDALTQAKSSAWEEMSKSILLKKESLATDTQTVASKKQALQTAKETLADDQAFLDELSSECDEKAKEYEKVKMLRSNEDVAITEAISVLSSDSTKDLFDTVSGHKSTTGFLQMSAIKSHVQSYEATPEYAAGIAQDILAKANANKSLRLTKMVSLLEAHKSNPFDVCLVEIEKMLKVIGQEHDADTEQQSWCNSELEFNTNSKHEKASLIEKLEGTVQALDTKINDPSDGLRAVLALAETNLKTNTQSQRDQAAQREAEHDDFVKSKQDAESAQVLLEKAVGILHKYYSQIDSEEEAFVQAKAKAKVHKQPGMLEGSSFDTAKAYKGQSDSGNKAIELLKYISSEISKEQGASAQEEADAEKSFQKSIQDLKDEADSIEDNIARLQEVLADSVSESGDKAQELKVAKRSKTKIEEYLKTIKPGCDFIATNFKVREEHRQNEAAALSHAVGALKSTPAYLASQSALGSRDERAHAAAYHKAIGQHLD